MRRLCRAFGMAVLAVLLAQCGSSERPPAEGGVQGGGPPQSQVSSPPEPRSSPAASVPTIVRGHIIPALPNATNTLSVDLQASDPLREAVAYRYQWFADGRPIYGATGAQLPPGEFVRGQTVSVEVTPIAGDRTGPVWKAPSVEIGNAPPRVRRLEIQPSPITRREAVKAVVEAADPDGDRVSLSYQWLRNGTPIAGATEATLPPNHFNRGDQLSVEVIATDGKTRALPVRSQQVDVLPAAPKFVSRVASSDFQDGRFRYRARAVHPDNKPLRYSLSADAPQGMRIHQETGVMEWDPAPAQRGSFAFQVIAEDSEGAKVAQPITLTVED